MRHCHPAVIAAAMFTATAMLAHALHAAPVTVSHANTPDTAPGGTVTITDMNTGTVTESNVTIVHTAKGLERLLDDVLASPDAPTVTPAKRMTPAQRTLMDKLTALATTGMTCTAHPYTPALLATAKSLATRGIITHYRDGNTLHISLTPPAAAAA